MLINQERLKFERMDKTPTTRNVPSTGFQFTNFRGRLVKTYNNKCLVLLQRIDRMEMERENMLTVLRSGFEVLIAKIGRSQRHEAELRSDQEARERERVGPAREGVFQELAQEFKQQLGLPEATSWRELSEDKVRVPNAMGQKFVEKLWQLAAPEEQRSTKSGTKGKRKLQLAHNPNVDRVLDKVLGPVSSASGSKPVSSASGSKPVSSASGWGPVSSSRGPSPVSSASGSKPVSSSCGPSPVSSARGSSASGSSSSGRRRFRLRVMTCCGKRRCLEKWWKECDKNGKVSDCPWCKKLCIPTSYWTSFLYKHETLHWESPGVVIDMTAQTSSDVNDVAGRQSETAMSDTEEVKHVEHESENEWEPPADDWDPQPTCGKSEREELAASTRARIDEEYEQAEVDDIAARANKGELNAGADSDLAWAVAASIEEANRVKMVEVRNDQNLEFGLWLREHTRAQGGGSQPKVETAADRRAKMLESVSKRLKTSTVTSATQEPATRATVTEALAAMTESLAAVTKPFAASESEAAVTEALAASNSEVGSETAPSESEATPAQSSVRSETAPSESEVMPAQSPLGSETAPSESEVKSDAAVEGTEEEELGSQGSGPDEEFGWPPLEGSFVAVMEASNAAEVKELFSKGAVRAWNLGRVVSAYEEEGVKLVKLTMFGTHDSNTLEGTYGVARQHKDGAWRFASTGPEGNAGKQEPEIYCWSECPVFEIEMTPAVSNMIPGATKSCRRCTNRLFHFDHSFYLAEIWFCKLPCDMGSS
eukprot:g8264.t1